MVNEDIITILNNSIIRGESIQQAMQILINSGYDKQQIYEASNYIQRGVMTNLDSNQNINLNAKENIDYNKEQNFNNFKKLQSNNKLSAMQESQNIANAIQDTGVQLKKKSYKKEIILLVILLFLIGFLAITLFFRDSILSFLSG